MPIPKSGMGVLVNRVAWALVYLVVGRAIVLKVIVEIILHYKNTD